jgi:hypothetical protein
MFSLYHMTSKVQDSVRTQTQEVRCKLFLLQSTPPWQKHTSYIFLIVAPVIRGVQRNRLYFSDLSFDALGILKYFCVEGGCDLGHIKMWLAWDQVNEVGGWSPCSDLPRSTSPSWQKTRTMSCKRKSLYFFRNYRLTFSVTCSNLISIILTAFLLM